MDVLKRGLLILTALSLACPARAGEDHPKTVNGWTYDRPTFWHWLKEQPADQKILWRGAFTRENGGVLLGLGVSTGLLIAADQYLYERSYKIGNQLNISHAAQQHAFVKTKLFNYTVRLSGPYDLGTGLYFLGDGITHFSVAGGFLVYGLSKSDDRALRTSSEMVESIFATGFIVQVLKHATGRENPNTWTSPGGKWRFFPNQKDYAKHVNKYDAYPTGHLATAMATVSVAALNYPEHAWIRPVGYTLMTALGFQMVNNGVHWYSDYPLGIALGYGFAKIAVQRGRSPAAPQSASLWYGPTLVGGRPGVAVWKTFGGARGKRA